MSSSLIHSFIEEANSRSADFPLNNLPFGVFSEKSRPLKKFSCTAIGDKVFNLSLAEELGLISDLGFSKVLLNSFMEKGKKVRQSLRHQIQEILSENSSKKDKALSCIIPMEDCTHSMPFELGEYTDFYSCKNHALNASKIIRGEDAGLSPNWYSLPVAYNGRKSSVIISGSDITRPRGQIANKETGLVEYKKTEKLDFELELGTVIGKPLEYGRTSDYKESEDLIFGFVLLNDWSARDIQSWEYQPLGPFLSKAFGTTISPWVITPEALEDFKLRPPDREVPLLPHFEDEKSYVFDINLSAKLIEDDGTETSLARTNAKELYYSPVQQVLHHSSSGSGMAVGDLLGSGTISGIEKRSRGCFLELTWGGTEPVELSSGKKRSFIQDNDTVILSGVSESEHYSIGFGDCVGKIIP